MGSLPATLIKIALVIPWFIYPLLAFLIYWLLRKNYRINIGTIYMFDMLVQTGKQGGEIKQVSKIIAHDAYAAGGRIYLMRYWIPAAFGGASLNGLAEYYLPRMSPSLAQIVLGTVVVLVFAFLLFLPKQGQQMMYGSVELAFAIWSSGFSLSRMNNTLTAPAVVGLFTSIYLTIRAATTSLEGMSNGKPESLAGPQRVGCMSTLTVNILEQRGFGKLPRRPGLFAESPTCRLYVHVKSSPEI
jgi:hypothetical protein